MPGGPLGFIRLIRVGILQLGHTTVEEEERNLVIFLHMIKDLGDKKDREEERRILKDI